MKKRYLFIAFLTVLFTASVSAKPISKSEALSIAKSFFQSGRNKIAPVEMKSVALTGLTETNTEMQPFYIFNTGNENGFVIVAGDDQAPAILGYSDKGSFKFDEAPQSLKEWMKIYSAYISSLPEGGNKAGQEKIKSENTAVIVEPILKDIAWGQDYPFNEKCPTYTLSGQEKHYYSGCVVAAATQIMRHYNYPGKGAGSHTYTFQGLTQSANFGETTYDWDNMINEYSQENPPSDLQIDAVATLASHFGIAVEMQYEQAASGTYTMMVPRAFKEFFGYDQALQMYMRNYYNSSEWMKMIKDELDAGRPVYYGGSSDRGAGGHAFVCDGYDSNDYVHINWGWFGHSNGFFMINHLDPSSLGIGGGSGGYNLNQEIIIGIQPQTGTPIEFERPIYGPVRLSVNEFNEKLSMTSYVQNMDTDPFEGVLAALLVQDKQIKRVIKEMDLSLRGFASGNSDAKLITMPEVELPYEGLEDGIYELRWGVKSTGTEKYQILRHYLGSPDHAIITVENGVVEFTGMYAPQPDVKLLDKLSTNGKLYAKGTALFHLNLRNDSRDVRIKNLLINFESKSDPSLKASSEAVISIYEEATEKIDVIVELNEALPAGEYYVTLSEKNYPDAVFNDSEVGRAEMTIHPQATTPIMRLDQTIEWKKNDGEVEIRQGDDIYLALAARNYGISGKIDLTTYLENVDNPEKTYVFRQVAANTEKGKQLISTFFKKLPVDPGKYRIYAEFTFDGQTIPVEAGQTKECIIDVLESKSLLVNAISFDCPDKVTKGEKANASITFEAPETDYDGTIFLRIRQLTITKGEIIYMGKNQIPAGEQKTISFSFTPSVEPGTYIVLVEARKGSTTEGTVGNYDNCYRIITVEKESAIEGTQNEEGIRVYPTVVTDKLYIESESEVHHVEIRDTNGRVLDIQNHIGNSISTENLSPGMYFLRFDTTHGWVTRKIIKK